MFNVYKRYPYKVSFRTKVFNLVRIVFTIPWLERILVQQLSVGRTRLWQKFIPPLYFYDIHSNRVVERKGIRYTVDISKLHGHSIYFCTIRNSNWDNLFKLLQPHFHVIDAGANIGFLSLYFAKHCERGHVYSFEPDSETFDYLQKSISQNKFTNITAFKTALGAESGEARLYKIDVSNPGANRILLTDDNHVNSEIVAVATLDNFYQQNVFTKVDLLKIDVEGFELFVLKGAVQLIKKWKPILFVELADVNLVQQKCTAIDVIDFIESLDYEVLDAATMLPIERTASEYYTDIICLSSKK